MAESLNKTSSLSANMALSPRAHVLLQRVLNCCLDGLGPGLMSTLVELEQGLFQLAECVPSMQEQVELYAEMKHLRDRKESFISCFCEGLVRAFVELKMPRQDVAAPLPMPTLGGALAGNGDIERDALLHDMACRQSACYVDALQLLGQRLAVLAAMPAFKPEQIPLGPHMLCRILRDCGERLELHLKAQLTLYRAFESKGMSCYGNVLESANRMLEQAGILPGLVYLSYVVRSSHVSGDPATKVTFSTEWSSSRMPPCCSQATAQRVSSEPILLSPDQQVLLPVGLGDSNIKHGSSVDISTGTDTTFQAGVDLSQKSDALQANMPAFLLAGAVRDGVFFPSGTYFNRQFGAMPSAFPRYRSSHSIMSVSGTDMNRSDGVPQIRPPLSLVSSRLPTADLNQLLSALQACTSITPARNAAWRSVSELRQHVLTTLRAQYGPEVVLSAQDDNVFELIDVLYGEIEREVCGGSPAADFLIQLQVPVVHAALQDSRFFVRDQHPVRELLNAIAESGATWLGEEELDPHLLQRLRSAVHKVLHEYQGDEAVFVQACQDIQAGYRSQVLKAEVTERRHIEAARGKERLELAKRRSTETIDRLCAIASPPRFVSILLSQTWLDVLTLSLLRHGEKSLEWQQCEALTEQICEITRTPAGGASDAVLSEHIEHALRHVGYHNEEASAIARRLSTPGGEDEWISRTELAARLKRHTKLGEHIAPVPLQDTIAPRNTAEETCYSQLRTLPFGTWLEFVMNQQGDVRHQRLCWYSPVTDHVLLIDPRGQKSSEHTLDTLARLLANGQMRIVIEENERLIDRAWSATMRTLRQLVGVRETCAEVNA
ncbi:MAG TPA: DUF1631 domain-containing protein [Xylella sp.]